MSTVLWSLIFVFCGASILCLWFSINYCQKKAPADHEYLPGMDVKLASENRRKGYTTIADPTPFEQQELLRFRAEQDKRAAYYKNSPNADPGTRFGKPSMGDQSAGLRNWDYRATRQKTQSSTTSWGTGPAFRNLRIAEQESPAPRTTTGHDEQSPYSPGMEVDSDGVDFHMGQLQLDDLYSPNSIRQHSQAHDLVQGANHAFADLRINDQGTSTTDKVRRHSQDYPPGINNTVQSVDSAFAHLQINDQGPSTANTVNTANNGYPHLPGMGYRHAFVPRGREDM
jgi:hypothetical protein